MLPGQMSPWQLESILAWLVPAWLLAAWLLAVSSWHLSRQHLSWQNLSISGISQLLLTQFLPNFNDRYLGTSRTDSNCHGYIVQAAFLLATFVHIRNISAVSNPIWPNFKGRFLGPSLTDANCHGRNFSQIFYLGMIKIFTPEGGASLEEVKLWGASGTASAVPKRYKFQ